MPSWAPALLTDIGVGGVAGFAIGFALKKILKLLLVAVGALLLVLTGAVEYLESKGILTVQVNNDPLNAWLSSTATWAAGQLGGVNVGILHFGVGATGLTGGLALGLYKG
jgi:uncharacterized membrane protein (Fun14 family)